MTTPDAISWTASVISLTSLWFYGNNSKWGPVFGLASQVPWFTLGIVGGLYGLFVADFVYLAMHVRNLRKHIKEGRWA